MLEAFIAGGLGVSRFVLAGEPNVPVAIVAGRFRLSLVPSARGKKFVMPLVDELIPESYEEFNFSLPFPPLIDST